MPKMNFGTQVGQLRFHFLRMVITKPAVHLHQSEVAPFSDMQSHHLCFVSPATCEWMKPFSHQCCSLTRQKHDPERNSCLFSCCVIELYQLTGWSNKLQSHHKWGGRLFGWEEVWVRGEGTRLPSYGKIKPLDILRCSQMQFERSIYTCSTRNTQTLQEPAVLQFAAIPKFTHILYNGMLLVLHLLFM